ncbi:uncharacterized protein L969DRAFT_91793 [Mixia osmundae IAM 14324]|uniref:F-box domain-containing protein n=1 Tax=Mixia osmundae (strain CBS 9802 / IAM 14324 / JCM 22182 / KY 12970) TaxID=764103 RepID=G7EAJ2_MIXOS|nr:uncharacterized protein L969DRAFT_91793 [Mixia osmundae IAM 14324]KEI42342.1 hypothetical protein L969DRAFT_91793 [Mixia osmundae IAM 14324]GAA99852.1 hypothetical protein E5Q_06555 [Mixia osmundae IAM 14324]
MAAPSAPRVTTSRVSYRPAPSPSTGTSRWSKARLYDSEAANEVLRPLSGSIGAHASGPPRKRRRLQFGAADEGANERMNDIKELAERTHASTHLAQRSDRRKASQVQSLVDLSLDKLGRSLRKVLRACADEENDDLAKSVLRAIADLPNNFSERLLQITLEHDPSCLSAGVLGKLFLRVHTERVDLLGTRVGVTHEILNRLAQCSQLRQLSLADQTELTDFTLAPLLKALRKLERLDLRRCAKVGDKSIIQAAQSSGQSLVYLNLNHTAITIKSLVSIISRGAKLETLKLESMSGFTDRNISAMMTKATEHAAAFRHAPPSNLKNLKVKGTAIGDVGLGHLLSFCPLLESLDISNTSISALDLLYRALTAGSHGWQLRSLSMSVIPVSSNLLRDFAKKLSILSEPARSNLSKLKMDRLLETSRIVSTNVETGAFEASMAAITSLAPLDKLGFAHQTVLFNDSTKPSQLLSACKDAQPQYLDLSGLPLPAHAFESWQSDDGSPTMPRLEHLHLDNCHIDDEVLIILAANCPNLRSLHMDSARITESCLRQVVAEMPYIDTLNLKGCRSITPAILRRTFFAT